MELCRYRSRDHSTFPACHGWESVSWLQANFEMYLATENIMHMGKPNAQVQEGFDFLDLAPDDHHARDCEYLVGAFTNIRNTLRLIVKAP